MWKAFSWSASSSSKPSDNQKLWFALKAATKRRNKQFSRQQLWSVKLATDFVEVTFVFHSPFLSNVVNLKPVHRQNFLALVQRWSEGGVLVVHLALSLSRHATLLGEVFSVSSVAWQRKGQDWTTVWVAVVWLRSSPCLLPLSMNPCYRIQLHFCLELSTLLPAEVLR